MSTHTHGQGNCAACDALRDSISLTAKINANLTFAIAADLWLESRKAIGDRELAHYIAPRTLRDYREYVGSLTPFFGELPLDKIHAGHLRAYQIERSATAGANKINQELGLLRRILQSCDMWTREVSGAHQNLRVPYADVPRALSPEEQTRFLQVAASRSKWELCYWYSIVALQTTATNCEMRNLRLGDVNLSEQVLQVRAARAKNQFRVRTIPLSDDCRWAIQRIYERAWSRGCLSPQHYLFPFRVGREVFDPTRPMTESGIKRSFEEIRAEAGVKWLRVHDLRHSAITRLAEAGVPIAVIMGLSGHIEARMVRHYTQVSDQAKRKAVQETFEKHAHLTAAAPRGMGPSLVR